MFDPITFVWIFTALFFIGCLIPIIGRRWTRATDLSLIFALTGSVYGAFVTGAIWLGFWSPPETAVFWTSSWMKTNDFINLPALQWEIHIDNLSAFFGFIITVFSGLVAVYSFESLKVSHYRAQSNRISAAFNIFIWSMLMVVIVNDAFSLLVTLEILSLTIAFLALYKHSLYQDDEEEAQHSSAEKVSNAQIAPQVYLIISHTSTVFLLIALLLLVIPAGSLSFDDLRQTSSVMDPARATTVFLLALAGLGMRAGLVPGHFWTPLVHPSSPANIHALLSGIAIKVSVYLMYRFFFQFLDPQPWWGYVVLSIAVITAVVNVWYAIASHDLKEALGYHSNENIGIILVGMGVAMVYTSSGSVTAQWIANLALVASLYHLLNHAVFKSLLYLATGAIDTLTHLVVDFNKLGGLIKRYPLTSAAFLVGAVSIAGFPPFNGFISEWLTLQVLFKGAGALDAKQTLGIFIIVFSLIVLVASFALTAFCFYKIVGLSLLGQPRSSEQEMKQWAERDVSWKMGGVMIVIALLCLFLGLFPGRVVPLLTSVTGTLGFDDVVLTSPSWRGLQFEAPMDKPDSLPISIMLGAALVIMLLSISVTILRNLLYALKQPSKYTVSEEGNPRQASVIARLRDTLITGHKRTTMPWNCGTPYSPETMQYTSAGLSELMRRMLDFLPIALSKRWKETTSKAPEYLAIRFPLSSSKAYPQEVIEHFRAIDNLFFKWLMTRSRFIGESIQNRDIRRYLGYIFLANILVLVLLLILGD